MSVLPSLCPYRRATLRRQIPESELKKKYLPVTRYAVAPRQLLRHEALVLLGAQGHPAGLHFRFDAITRARAHYFHNENTIVGGWGAAAYLGLQFWVDDAQSVLHVDGGGRISTDPMCPSRVSRSKVQAVHPDPLFPGLKSASAEYATVECLRQLSKGSHSWRVSQVPGLDATVVRSVQLVDAMRRCAFLDIQQLKHASRGVYDQARLKHVLALSADGVDSPPETILRLLAAPLAPGVETQIPIYGANGILTAIDVGWREPRVGLFYDGAHHLQRRQRDYDSEVLAALGEMGWKVLRVTQGMLRNPAQLQQRIARLLYESKISLRTA